MAETIFLWVVLFTSACAFIFSYGIAEDLIRQWLRDRRSRKLGESPPLASPLRVHDQGGNGHGDASLLH